MRNGSLCVIWFDPGGTTGWAAYQAEVVTTGLDSQEFYKQKIIQGQLGPEEHHLALWNLLGMMHAANYVIGMESFEHRQDQRAKVELVSKEYIAVAKLYVEERNTTLPPEAQVEYYEQSPSHGKGFWYPPVAGRKNARDGSKLKHLGLHVATTKGHHQNDATAHLLQWLTEGPFKQGQWYAKIKDMA